jgi:hypothetical protein
MAFSCQVCFEEKTVRLALPRLMTGNNDVLRADDCQHPVCQECLATFLNTRIEDQRVFNIRCPIFGCTTEIFEQDVQRLVQTGAVSTENSERFVELRSRDYSARAEALSGALIESTPENDYESIKRIWQTMRLCPRCNLAIERSQGCNSFYCTCGHHFHFSTAPRVVGNGIEQFDKVIEVAKTLSLPLAFAEELGRDDGARGKRWTHRRAMAVHRNVSKIAAESGTQLYDAWRLQQRAKNGDEVARAKIRAAKHRTSQIEHQNGEQEHEEEESLVWDFLAVEASESEVMTTDVDMCATRHNESVPEDVNISQEKDDDMHMQLVAKEFECMKIIEKASVSDSLCSEMMLLNCTTNEPEM